MKLDFEEEAAIRIAPLAIDPFIFFTVPTGFSQNQIESVLFDARFSRVDALGVIFVVILEGISDPIMDSGYQIADIFVRGIQSGLQPGNYLPLLMDTQTQRKLFDSYLKMILERRAEGVIVIASWIFEETNLLADIKKNQVPIVILGRDMTRRKISSLLVDNEAGGSMAMRHLIELGHKHIAAIRGPEELFDSEPRWTGVKLAAAQAGIEFDPSLVMQLPNLMDSTSGFEGGRQFARQMLESRRPFTAVVAFDDLTALGVVRGLADAGLRVPEDCSVVGFDDVLPARVATPAITTIRQPLQEMGLQAAQWTLEAIKASENGAAHAAQLFMAKPELVLRTSTSRPAGSVKASRKFV